MKKHIQFQGQLGLLMQHKVLGPLLFQSTYGGSLLERQDLPYRRAVRMDEQTWWQVV